MRIWHVILCLLVTQSVSLAGANDYWRVMLRACDSDGAYGQFTSEYGTALMSSDGPDDSDICAPSANSHCARISCFDLGQGLQHTGYYADYRAPIASSTTWNLKIHVGASWTAPDVSLRLWNPPGDTGATDINGTIPISLKVTSDPTGTHSPGDILIPSWDADKNGTQVLPAYTFTFNNAAALLGGAAIELQLTARTASETVCSIGLARGIYAGQPVVLNGVTASSGDTDRAGPWVFCSGLPGLRIPSALGIARREVVDVSGTVVWTDGVPVLTNPQLRERHGTAEPPARMMSGSAVGNDRREMLGYSGINPVGTLCVACGEVTARDTGLGVFYVDDGTGLADGLGPSNEPYRGLRIVCGTGISLPGLHTHVRVTGVRSVEKHVLSQAAMVNGEQRQTGETLYVPVILIRDADDIF